MDDKSQKSKLIDKIKDANNILITVSRNPNIDQLTSALALALAINRLDKRAVAVFSGRIPKSLNFLNPQKTFESNADSLRDFIILIDKEKAGRLRVNADGDFAKVYITPYRTKITAEDIKFEDGDFNVELIIAIGVTSREELDSAIASHGKIFHDAITATINMDKVHDVLGSISWQDEGMDCYSEMVAELVNALSAGQNHVLMDEAVATALLTGVVSATDQFRNKSTTPSIMSLAADLMAHGANQQLISSELASEIEPSNKQSSDKVEYDRRKKPNTETHRNNNPSNNKPDTTRPSNEFEITHNNAANTPKPADHSVFAGVTAKSKPNVDNLAQTLMDAEQKHGDEVNRMNKMVVEENSRLAQARSEDAVAVAHSQLTEDELDRQNAQSKAASLPTSAPLPSFSNERLAPQPEPVATLSPTMPASPASIPTSIKPVMMEQSQPNPAPTLPPIPTLAPAPQPQSVRRNVEPAVPAKPTPAYMIANRTSPLPPLPKPALATQSQAQSTPLPIANQFQPQPVPVQPQTVATPDLGVPLPPPPPLPDFSGINLGGETSLQQPSMPSSSLSSSLNQPMAPAPMQPATPVTNGSADLAAQAANLAQPATSMVPPMSASVTAPAPQQPAIPTDPTQFVIPS